MSLAQIKTDGQIWFLLGGVLKSIIDGQAVNHDRSEDGIRVEVQFGNQTGREVGRQILKIYMYFIFAESNTNNILFVVNSLCLKKETDKLPFRFLFY